MQGKRRKTSAKKASAEDQKPAEEAGTPEAELSLRGAREARGISIDDVVHDLHLSRDVVLALEEGDYDSLGAPVFVRGHLRSYARLLELPEDAILDQYQVSEHEFVCMEQNHLPIHAYTKVLLREYSHDW